MKRDTLDRGSLLVLAAAACWGTTGTAQAFAPADASSASIGAVRLLVGGLALAAFAAGQGLHRRVRELPFWPTLLAGIAIALYQVTFFAGVRRTGVAVGTVVAIGSAPIVAGLLSVVLLRQPPGRRWLVATALAIAGCTLLILQGGDLVIEPAGMALAIGAGACYALYTLYIKRIVRAVPADLAAGSVFGLGALLLLPVFVSSDLTWMRTPRGALVALELGLVATALAYVLFTRAMRTVAVSTAVTLALGEPVVASMLGVVVLGEVLSRQAWLGIALVFAGLVYLTAMPAQPRSTGANHVPESHPANPSS